MKILPYVLAMGILISGIDQLFVASTNVYACPRCRRAQPKGPRKRPHPGFAKKETHQTVVVNNTSTDTPKNDMKEKS